MQYRNDCSCSTKMHHQQAQVLLDVCQRLVRMQTFESIRNTESSVYTMIDFRTICSLHNCHIEPCLAGLSYLGAYCCPKKDCKHVIFTCLVRYSSAKGRPAAQCLCHSSIGGFACVALRCSTALSHLSSTLLPTTTH